MTRGQRKLFKLVHRWVPILGLDQWDLSIDFTEKTHQATVEAKPEYEEAIIHFNLKRIRKELTTDEDLNRLVLHELAHLLTWGCNEDDDDRDELRTTHVEKALWRAYQVGQLESVNGLTEQQYKEILRQQNGKCAICRLSVTTDNRKGRLSVDHNHATGIVRGLLCGHCNKAIGLLRDDPTLARRLAKYLSKEVRRL